MQRSQLTTRHVEASLNRAYADWESSSDAATREFFLLKLQVLIFYFDVVVGIVGLGRNKPKGFALAVALKSLVHSLYEYDKQLNRTLVPRVMRYASSQRRPINTSTIKAERQKWRDQLVRLKAWKDTRDKATGHYGRDIERQVRLVEVLGQDEVLNVAMAFVHYSVFVMQLLPHRRRSDA